MGHFPSYLKYLVLLYFSFILFFCSQYRTRTCIGILKSFTYSYHSIFISIYQFRHLTMLPSFRAVSNFFFQCFGVATFGSQDRICPCNQLFRRPLMSSLGCCNLLRLSYFRHSPVYLYNLKIMT